MARKKYCSRAYNLHPDSDLFGGQFRSLTSDCRGKGAPGIRVQGRRLEAVGQRRTSRLEQCYNSMQTMAEAEKDPEVNAASEEPESEEQQSVMSRLGSLPFVSSACSMVSSAYTTTKEGVPLLKGVMDVAESGVQMLGSVATSGSKPLLDRLEPQIAAVNEYAMLGLDKVEQSLPILHQPADKVVSDTVDKVYQSVSGAKEAVTGAVMGAMEMTRAAMSGSLNTVMGSRVGQMVSSRVGLALSHSENWVDHNLPLTERELVALAEPAPDAEALAQSAGSASPSSYFVRLGKLSSKVQERAREQSLAKAQHARDITHSAVAQIGSTLDLLESARTTLATANAQLGGASEQLLQRWAEWQQGHPKEEEAQGEDKSEGDPGELEWRALSMVRGLSGQLQSACSGVVSSAQGLPGTVQEQLANARRVAQELHSSLGNTSTLSPQILEQTRLHLAQVQRSLDGVTEYLLNNTPLNWLVDDTFRLFRKQDCPPSSPYPSLSTSMAQETNQTQVPMLCTTGCGFYGNPRTSGMCSVCYKEHLQRQKGGGRASPPAEKVATAPVVSPAGAGSSVESTPDPNTDGFTKSEERKSSSPSPVTQQMIAMSLSQDSGATDSDQAEEEEEGPSKSTGLALEAAQPSSDGDQTPDKSKKKNRCFTCRKKVGLTGLPGGLYYSHGNNNPLPDDYSSQALTVAAATCSAPSTATRTNMTVPMTTGGAAAARIRKENPIVVAEKIQKL
ncbi:hypothetical protein SKAU_G00050380 [Synaphobranchus kaupii]|uniref:A20-type domain-containing protein n=1 Tax=Synaphobranchus kaupii TaxID=118154 RepID=A0A9Q1G3R3_SYNKA|nr:hypothetical protein SKAU_G00050380 [Synaphobranchus kaupii]